MVAPNEQKGFQAFICNVPSEVFKLELSQAGWEESLLLSIYDMMVGQMECMEILSFMGFLFDDRKRQTNISAPEPDVATFQSRQVTRGADECNKRSDETSKKWTPGPHRLLAGLTGCQSPPDLAG